jgi:hypothetical protein
MYCIGYKERCTLGTLEAEQHYKEYLGTQLERLKNTTKNSVISWHNTGKAEEHCKERCNILAQYWTG